jgi:hypothetical protein
LDVAEENEALVAPPSDEDDTWEDGACMDDEEAAAAEDGWTEEEDGWTEEEECASAEDGWTEDESGVRLDEPPVDSGAPLEVNELETTETATADELVSPPEDPDPGSSAHSPATQMRPWSQSWSWLHLGSGRQAWSAKTPMTAVKHRTLPARWEADGEGQEAVTGFSVLGKRPYATWKRSRAQFGVQQGGLAGGVSAWQASGMPRPAQAHNRWSP